MPRRERSEDFIFDSALQKVSRLLNSPLNEVGEKLRDCLSDTKRSCEKQQLTPNEAIIVASHLIRIADRLPQSFDERFHFDSTLIRAISDDWGANLSLSHMIMPRHESEWGHERLVMPSEDLNHAHVIELIHMPGADRLAHVDLLNYPWIIHEMGHYLLLQYDHLFVPAFKIVLKNTESSLRVAAMADRGSARVKAQSMIDQLIDYWTPRPDQKNWAHELAIDLISLCTCGPAYLACFYDAVQNPDINPYELTPTHPPYAVRTEALVTAAGRLGLQKFTVDLQGLLSCWDRSKWKKRKVGIDLLLFA